MGLGLPGSGHQLPAVEGHNGGQCRPFQNQPAEPNTLCHLPNPERSTAAPCCLSAKEASQELDMDEQREEQIRKRAYELWLGEGQPEGRAEQHWAQAREIIAIENGYESTLIPVSEAETGEPVEPIEALENAGEFPTITDQGEMKLPKRRGRMSRVNQET
jgi:hypothetical protein